MAHRLVLVAQWAAKTVPYLATVQNTLVSVYQYYQYSVVRYKLKELKQIMDQHVRCFKKPTQVHWLSLQDSVLAMISAWGVLVMALGQEAAASNTDGSAQAKGTLTVVKTSHFISTVCMLADALQVLCGCCRVFQKDVLDINEVEDMLETTKLTLQSLVDNPGHYIYTQDLFTQIELGHQFQGVVLEVSEQDKEQLKNITHSFVSNVIEEINKRFPAQDMSVTKDLASILDPRQLPARNEGLADHGQGALGRLLDRYACQELDIDAEQARCSFLQFKFLMTRHREKNLPEMCRLLLTQHADNFPVFAKFAALSLTIPLSYVPCKRGFSAQNCVHTSRRSSLSVKSVNNKLTIWHESKNGDFDESAIIQKACDVFNTMRPRI